MKFDKLMSKAQSLVADIDRYVNEQQEKAKRGREQVRQAVADKVAGEKLEASANQEAVRAQEVRANLKDLFKI